MRDEMERGDGGRRGREERKRGDSGRRGREDTDTTSTDVSLPAVRSDTQVQMVTGHSLLSQYLTSYVFRKHSKLRTH